MMASNAFTVLFFVSIAAFIVSHTAAVVVTLEGGAKSKTDKKVQIGELILLECSFSPSQSGSQSQAQLDWVYHKTADSNEFRLVRSGIVSENYRSRVSIQPVANLQIVEAVVADTGFYECNVFLENDNPNTGKGIYNLTITVPPSKPVCSFTSDNKITLGFQEQFRCRSTEGIPSPTYTWYKDGLPLPENGQADTKYQNTSYSYSHETGVLTFARVTRFDEGEYYCTSTNEVGSAECKSAKITTKEQDIMLLIGIGIAGACVLIIIGIASWCLYSKGYCVRCCGPPARGKRPQSDFDEYAMESRYEGSKGGRAPSEFSGYSAGKKTDIADVDGYKSRPLEDQREFSRYSRDRLDDQTSEYTDRRLKDQGEYSRYSREKLVDERSDYSRRSRDDNGYNRGRRLEDQREYSRYSRERLDEAQSDYGHNRRLDDQGEYSRNSRERLDDPNDYRDRRLEDQREYSRYSRERLDDRSDYNSYSRNDRTDYDSYPRDNRSDYNSYPRENRGNPDRDYRRYSMERQLDYNSGRNSQAPSDHRSGYNDRVSYVPDGAVRVMP